MDWDLNKNILHNKLQRLFTIFIYFYNRIKEREEKIPEIKINAQMSQW